MSKKEARAIYYSMKESGDLLIMLPGSSGEWIEDQKSFMKMYENNIHILQDSFLDLGEEDDYVDSTYDDY